MTATAPKVALLAEPEAARRLVGILRNEGVEAVVVVGGAEAALRAVHRLDPAVVIVHARLMQGRLVEALRLGALPPLIVVGDAEDADALVACVEAGAMAAIELPVEPGLIGRLLQRGRALYQLEVDREGWRPSPPPPTDGPGGGPDEDPLLWQPVARVDDLGLFGFQLAASHPDCREPMPAVPPMERVAAELAGSTPPGAVFVPLPAVDSTLRTLGTAGDPLGVFATRLILQCTIGGPAGAVGLGELRECERRLHEAGYRIALEVAGWDPELLAHLFALRPELVVLGAESWRPARADPSEARLTASIVQAARSLGVGVVAEGVATPVDREFIRALGCALLAGPLLGAPAPAATWVRSVVPRDRRRPR